MGKKINKIGVLTSGGDAPGMNAAIRSVVRTCAYYNVECVGIHQGYQGVLEKNFERLTARDVANVLSRGGTFLRSARCLEFKQPENRTVAYNNLKEEGIDALVVIGGDGSFTGAMLLENEHEIPVIGIPGTIDNDIYGTDFTLGYDTALNTAVDAIDKIRDTASSHDRLFFVEVMGRDAGFIALNTGIAGGAEEILIPEEDMGFDRLMESLKGSSRSGKTSSIVVVAEGEKIGGNVFELANRVEKELPEYEIKVSVLGHVQRGGAPSCFDRVLASRLGVAAVEGLLDGKSKVMAGVRDSKVVFTDLENAIKQHNPIDTELLRVSEIMSV